MGIKASKRSLKDLKPAFDIYVEKVGKDGYLTPAGFRKWLNEAFIIGEDSGVTVVEIENVLAKNIGKGRQALDFNQFKKCIEDLIKRKKLDRTEIIDQLVSAAGVHNTTQDKTCA